MAASDGPSLPRGPGGEERPAPPAEISARREGDDGGIVPVPVSGSGLMQGVRAAATITAGTLALEGITYLSNRLTGGHQAVWFLLLGMTIAGGGVLVLALAAARLPRRAQPPFWAVGILFVSICFLLVGQACGVF